jgi:hypothetical protein
VSQNRAAVQTTPAHDIAGRNPAGLYIFTRNGHFSFQTTAEFPKFESGDRMEALRRCHNKRLIPAPQPDLGAIQSDAAYAVDLRIEGGLAYGGGETERRGVFGNS